MGVGAQLETHFLWRFPAFKWHPNATHGWKHVFCWPSRATQTKPHSSSAHCCQQKPWMTLSSGKFMHVFHPRHKRLTVQKQTTITHHISSIVQFYCPERPEIPSYQWENFIFFWFVWGLFGGGVGFYWAECWGFCLFVWPQNKYCVTDSPRFVPNREMNRRALSDKSRNCRQSSDWMLETRYGMERHIMISQPSWLVNQTSHSRLSNYAPSLAAKTLLCSPSPSALTLPVYHQKVQAEWLVSTCTWVEGCYFCFGPEEGVWVSKALAAGIIFLPATSICQTKTTQKLQLATLKILFHHLIFLLSK